MAGTGAKSVRYDVTLLYATQQKDVAKRVKTHLEENGFAVGFDEKNGVNVSALNRDIIINSRIVSICLSEHYQSSSNFQQELRLIEDYNKRVILLRMDLCNPEGRLKTRADRQLKFQSVEDGNARDFFLAVTKLVNCVHAILNEGPDIGGVTETMNDMHVNIVPRGGGVFSSQQVFENNSIVTESERQHRVASGSDVNASIENIPPDPNEELGVMVQVMGKPLKDLPGLIMLSRLMDPITTVDRVVQLASCYEFSNTDLQHIQGTDTGDDETPAFSLLRFLESSNNDMLISELRECFNTRRAEFMHALAAINLYTDEQMITDIGWLDMKNLAASGFDWKYVADYFGYGAHIAELNVPRMDVGSRFDTLCDLISAQFPNHIISEFVANCQRLQFDDVVQTIENNIKEYAERTLRKRERNNVSLR